MTEITVTDPSALDFKRFVEMQRAAYAEIIAQTGTDYLFSEPYYRWKYDSPAGHAKIVLIADGEGLVAANSMFPVAVACGETNIIAWQSCDTATHPRGRGKGYFKACLQALKAELPENSIFLGFPNKNSMHGFSKLGWTNRADLNAWIRVSFGFGFRRFPAVREINQFGDREEVFFHDLISDHHAMFRRDADYMVWRYRKHPLHKYHIFGWYEGGQLLGVAVLRKAKVSGREITIVMEIFAQDRHVERGLLGYAANYSRENGLLYTASINNTQSLAAGLFSGYLPVPGKMLPRRPVLMGAPNGAAAEALWGKPWTVQIGDWDGF